MEGIRGYTTTIIVGFVVVALCVLGLRWHALAQRATVTPASAQLYSYAPPKRGDSSAAPHSASGETPGGSAKGRGVSPSKAPTKPTPTVYETKPKSSEHHSAKKVLPKAHSININTATQAQLEQLPGVGPSIAGRIISYRNEHGKFSSVDGLDEVKGIGPKKLADIAPYCYVD
jgi:competence protein ComEA